MKTNPNDPINAAEVGFSDGIQQESFQSDNTVGKFMGLTKREYFAAMAMQGFIAGVRGSGDSIKPIELCQSAIMVADSLINELNRK